MAGRFVVLEFDDADAAQVFVDRQDLLETQGASVRSMFIRPDKFCDCPDKKRQQASNWVKGKRTGLYLCKTCRRPSIHHQTGIEARLLYVFGKNLLEND